jgi:anti-anti-sigma factor
MHAQTELHIEPGATSGFYVLRGDIDLDTAPRIADISPESTGPASTIVLDFSGVSFIDSIGIWALVNLAQGLDGGKLVISNASDGVRRTFDLVDLSDVPGIVVEP